MSAITKNYKLSQQFPAQQNYTAKNIYSLLSQPIIHVSSVNAPQQMAAPAPQAIVHVSSVIAPQPMAAPTPQAMNVTAAPAPHCVDVSCKISCLSCTLQCF